MGCGRGITAYKNTVAGVRTHGSANIRLEGLLVADSWLGIDLHPRANTTVRSAHVTILEDALSETAAAGTGLLLLYMLGF